MVAAKAMDSVVVVAKAMDSVVVVAKAMDLAVDSGLVKGWVMDWSAVVDNTDCFDKLGKGNFQSLPLYIERAVNYYIKCAGMLVFLLLYFEAYLDFEPIHQSNSSHWDILRCNMSFFYISSGGKNLIPLSDQYRLRRKPHSNYD